MDDRTAERDEHLSIGRKKQKRQHIGGTFAVLEGSTPASVPGKLTQSEPDESAAKPRVGKKRFWHGLKLGGASAPNNQELVDLNFPRNFGRDYFQAFSSSGMKNLNVDNVLNPSETFHATPPPEPPHENRFDSWLELLKAGFSLLVLGVGSKKQLLDKFVDEKILQWGAAVVRINCFSARLSLHECLCGLLEQISPDGRSHNSLAATAEAICAIQKLADVRPLCFVAHSLEDLQPTQQAIFANLASTPNIHLIASTDNIWTPLAWEARLTTKFNFCIQEVHTHESYKDETFGRFGNNLPSWTGQSDDKRKMQTASIALVLRSLTNSHCELVQAIAEHQLEQDPRGISMHALLTVANDRLIAGNLTKLKAYLNELRDHELVVRRGSVDGRQLFLLPCREQTLRRLADGAFESEEESGNEEGPLEELN